MVFYFTATGNSLHVAKQLDQEPISIPQVMKKESLVFEDDVMGLVSPIYAGELPKLVAKFLSKAEFKTDYFYMILTYGMNDSVAGEWAFAFAKEHGIHIHFIQTITMVDNYLPVFDMNEQISMERKVDEQILSAKNNVAQRKIGIPVPTAEGRAAYTNVKKRDPKFNDGSQIMVTNTCNGCGICKKVCPVGLFYVNEGKAHRTQTTCEFCLACAQNCPQKAITLKIMDKNPEARYRNENISLAEIIESNHQYQD